MPGEMERDSLALYAYTRCQAGRLPCELEMCTLAWRIAVLCLMNGDVFNDAS